MLQRVLTICIVSLCCLAILLSSACTKASNRPAVEDNTALVPDTTAAAPADTNFSEGFTFTEYDTPPTPVENPMPAYPPKFRSSGIQGVVLLDVTVNADGTVGDIAIKKSLLTGLGGPDEAAVTAVKNWIFKPALKDNKPVSAKVNIPIPFTLK
jgi:periplasmic protein TonB